MSSPSRASSESARLLPDSPLADDRQSSTSRSRSLSRERFNLSPQTRFIPVVLATELACQLPATTFIELARLTVCKFVQASTGAPAGNFLQLESPLAERCDAPQVVRYFAFVMSILSVVEGISWGIGYGLLSHMSSRFGRKPALLLLLASGVIGSFMIPGSQFAPDWLAGWVFLLGVVFRMLSGSPPQAYVASLYVTDVCTEEDRTAGLSMMGGWSTLGVSISLALGGIVTTKTRNPLIVFYMATAIFAAVFIYTVLFLPESFPAEKRDALARLQRENYNNSRPTTRFSSLPILGPLKLLAPTRRSDGTRNWRLTWCTIHNFIFMFVSGYAASAWMVLATSRYHLSPADTGLFFSIVTMSSTIAFIAVLPPLVRFLRPYYTRKTVRFLQDVEDIPDDGGLNAGTSDRLDVHLAFGICVITAISYLGAAAATTTAGVIISGIFIGLTITRGPPMRSIVVGSVDPLKQSEALAAFEMVTSVATVLSPVVMGGILTATIDSMPLLFFYIHTVVVLLSGLLLVLIRDEDRYQKLQES